MTDNDYKRVVSTLETFRFSSGSTRCRLSVAGKVLSKSDLIRISDGLTITILLWCDILSVYSSDLRWVGRYFGSETHHDVRSLGLFLKAADDLVIRDRLQLSYPDFKGQFKEYECGELISIFRPIYLSSISIHNRIRDLHQCFAFFGRISLQDDYGQRAQTIEKWLEIEARLSSQSFQSIGGHFNMFLRDWKPTRNPICRHGSGNVSDCPKGLSEKYRNCHFDTRIARLLDDPISVLPFADRRVLNRHAKLVTVPKSLLIDRTIVMEPATLQFLQQGWRLELERYVRLHPYLRRRIDLKRPEKNRDAAWEGSIDGHLSTIDLSSASDSIHSDLIRLIFRDTDIPRIVFGTRSDFCLLPDGSLHKIQKISAMGSSMNFIIECLVFCALVEIGIGRCGVNPKYSHYRVYGDDIIVETEYYNSVVETLQDFGFEVNTSKSFSSTGSLIFRESCGGEYLDGHDITAVRIPRKFSGFKGSPDGIWPAHCVELCNRLYHYKSPRRYIIQKLNALPKSLRPLFNSTGEGAIFSTEPTNFHLNKSFDINYQSDCVYHGRVRVDYTGVRDDEVAYYEQLRVTDQRPRLLYPEDRVVVETRTPQHRKKWVKTRSFNW